MESRSGGPCSAEAGKVAAVGGVHHELLTRGSFEQLIVRKPIPSTFDGAHNEPIAFAEDAGEQQFARIVVEQQARVAWNGQRDGACASAAMRSYSAMSAASSASRLCLLAK